LRIFRLRNYCPVNAQFSRLYRLKLLFGFLYLDAETPLSF
jgi:hypothetical protein